MTIPFSTPPEDVSPGSLNSPRFMNLSLSQLNKISLGLLKNKVTTAPE